MQTGLTADAMEGEKNGEKDGERNAGKDGERTGERSGERVGNRLLTLSFVVVASDGHTDLLSGKNCDSFIETEQKLDKSYGETIVERKSQWKSKTHLQWTICLLYCENIVTSCVSKISIVVFIPQWFLKCLVLVSLQMSQFYSLFAHLIWQRQGQTLASPKVEEVERLSDINESIHSALRKSMVKIVLLIVFSLSEETSYFKSSLM